MKAKIAGGYGRQDEHLREASSADSSTDSLVIYVHGVAQTDLPADLKLSWDLALFGRDMGETSAMAYWADVVRPDVLKPSVAKAERDLPFDDAVVNVDAVLNEANIPESELPQAQQLAMGLLRDMGIDSEVDDKGRLQTKALPLPLWLRKPMSRIFIQGMVADTAAYFFKPGVREEVRKRLQSQIAKAQRRPVTIVAHSQGSIIAFEVLSILQEDGIELDALVTLGSPLGVQEVQDYLDPGEPLQVPTVVERWHNFSDPLDPVALDKKLSSDFNPLGFIEDAMLINNRTRLDWNFNPHSAVGYLAHPKVRTVVNDAMRLDVMSRFVLARDVAERLGAEPHERHSVLIEVLEPGYGALGESEEVTETLEHDEQERLKRPKDRHPPQLKLEHRIEDLVSKLQGLVGEDSEEAACIDPLRRFVSARLTAAELRTLAHAHQELRIYAVWRSSRKSKLTSRSMGVLKADAALRASRPMARASPGRFWTREFALTTHIFQVTLSRRCGTAPSEEGRSNWLLIRIPMAMAPMCAELLPVPQPSEKTVLCQKSAALLLALASWSTKSSTIRVKVRTRGSSRL